MTSGRAMTAARGVRIGVVTYTLSWGTAGNGADLATEAAVLGGASSASPPPHAETSSGITAATAARRTSVFMAISLMVRLLSGFVETNVGCDARS